jgi:prevent-host-death family protein
MPDSKENSEIMIDVEMLLRDFEELVDQASKGKEIVITNDNKPFAKLVPV